MLYVSLTWNGENRFGGGNHTHVGLKRDGELFLEHIDGKKIAIDLSHASDQLAGDILNYIDKKGLQVTPIASHSNLRAVCDDARNLPDEFALEIIRREGVIGFNLVRKFVGEKPPEGLLAHLHHLALLGGERHHCLGADFFFEGSVAPSVHFVLPFFYPHFDDSSCYPRLLEPLEGEVRERIAHANFEAFVAREGLHVSCG